MGKSRYWVNKEAKSMIKKNEEQAQKDYFWHAFNSIALHHQHIALNMLVAFAQLYPSTNRATFKLHLVPKKET